jgi:AcrR family transcriptional regulator
MRDDVRTRILEGTYRCVARQGIAGTSVEDAARESGVSRATVYRYFPGGRAELVSAVIAFESVRFFGRLADAVGSAPDLESLLVDGILFAHRAIEEHDVLQKVLETEPELLVPQLTVESAGLVALVAGFLTPRLPAEGLPPDLESREVADYLARMLLSFIGAPGRWDLADRDQVRLLVRSELLAGLSARASVGGRSAGRRADGGRASLRTAPAPRAAGR